ncbi:MAG: outer membrane lipoprotein [Planctomycetota bacterium]|jgi:outer membrane lipoprotein SlyB
MKIHILFVLLAISIFIAGCGPAHSGSTYSRSEAGKAQTVEDGEVIFIREVQVEGSKSGLGMVAGGILGYAVGNTVGGGSGKTVARAAGTVGGAAAGAAVEEKSTREIALEITVQLDNGKVVAVVQSADEKFEEGDKVRVLQRPDGTARVIQ